MACACCHECMQRVYATGACNVSMSRAPCVSSGVGQPTLVRQVVDSYFISRVAVLMPCMLQQPFQIGNPVRIAGSMRMYACQGDVTNRIPDAHVVHAYLGSCGGGGGDPCPCGSGTNFDVQCYKCGDNPLSCLVTGNPGAADLAAIKAALKSNCGLSGGGVDRTCAEQQCSNGILVSPAPAAATGECLLSTNNSTSLSFDPFHDSTWPSSAHAVVLVAGVLRRPLIAVEYTPKYITCSWIQRYDTNLQLQLQCL